MLQLGMNTSLPPHGQVFNCSGNHSTLGWNGNQTSTLEQSVLRRIEQFIHEFLPFIELVQGLLYYGTAAIVAFGVTLNALSFYFVRKEKMRRSAYSIFLTVLTLYDSLALLLNFMVGVIRGQSSPVNQSFMDNQHLCKMHGVMVELFNLLSVWTIVVFTVERFIVVRFPRWAKEFTPKKIILTIAASSLLVLIFSCHKVYFTGFEGDSVFGYKGCRTDRLLLSEIIYFYVAFNTWLPTLLILVFNFAIIKTLRAHQARRETVTNSTCKLDKKATRLLLSVSLIYLMLVLPLGIVQTIEVFYNAKISTTPITASNYVQQNIIKIKLKWVRAFFFFFYQLNFANIFPIYIVSSVGSSFLHWSKIKQLFGFAPRLDGSLDLMPGEILASNAIVPVPATRPVCSMVMRHNNFDQTQLESYDTVKAIRGRISCPF